MFQCMLLDTDSQRYSHHSLVWKATVPSKVKVFGSLFALGKLNTKDVMPKRKPYLAISPYWCVLCNKDGETADHLLLHCPRTSTFGVSWIIPRQGKDLLQFHSVYCLLCFMEYEKKILDTSKLRRKKDILWQVLGCEDERRPSTRGTVWVMHCRTALTKQLLATFKSPAPCTKISNKDRILC